jgi:hypothetical protein
LILRLLFVDEVSLLEFDADIKDKSELIKSFLWLLVLDVSKDLLSINIGRASLYDSIADFLDQDNKSGWSVVMLRVVPDQKDCVHNWKECIRAVFQVLRGISKLTEQVDQSLQVKVVLIGLIFGNLNFLLKLTERTCEGGLVLL